ncbi:MAG: hypothetical protein AB7V46_24710 [Thermomicrobiales bacterium]
MQPLVELIVSAGLGDRVLSDGELARLVGGSHARRYGLVNRALKDGSLIRLKRGTYMLASHYQSVPVHPFVVAQALLPGSYISFETALAYHGWIPEAVYTTASITPGRKTLVYDDVPMGPFSFHPLAIRDYQFLAAIDRHKLGALTAFVARPLRALMDMVAFKKERWAGLDWLTLGMRIDEASLRAVCGEEFAKLARVYKHQSPNAFLRELEVALCNQTPHRREAMVS